MWDAILVGSVVGLLVCLSECSFLGCWCFDVTALVAAAASIQLFSPSEKDRALRGMGVLSWGAGALMQQHW